MSDLFEVYNDVPDEFEQEQLDEKPLGDLHLGNALNLDEVEEAIFPGSIEYNIKVFQGLEREVQIMIPYLRSCGYSIYVGMLVPGLSFVAPIGDEGKMPVVIFKEAIQIVYRGLKSRGYDIPLTRYTISDNLPDIYVKERWILTFGKLLRLLCTRSEMLRGGLQSPYPDIVLNPDRVSTDFTIDGNVFRIVSGRFLTICIDSKGKSAYVGNVDSLLLILDTLGQRICLSVGNYVGSLYGVTGFTKTDILDDILSTGDLILIKFGNAGYDIIALFEALCVAEILRQSPDGIVDESMFGRACDEEIIEMLQLFEDSEGAIELIESWKEMLVQLPISVLSNIFCLYRCWGHPRVDIKRGMEKVHRIGTARKCVPPIISKIVLWQFRKIILTNYFRKHHRYPPIKYLSDENSYVRHRIHECLPIDDRDPSYYVASFDSIEICQIWGVPETYDICHILNDKAVSPTVSELIESLRSGHGTQVGTLRRGIVRWMRGESLNCKGFLDDISKNGLDDDSCAIGLYEKEREIKIVARMFSLMSERMRYYFVLTEELIANHILPYFPEITMKDSLNVLLKKVWTIGGLGKDSSYDVNINIDFSKWNLNMRDDLTNHLFSQMDVLFGYTNLISQTHNIFSRSYIYSCSGKYLPKLDGDNLMEDYPMAYRGHVGGFEGLRQKGWTVATVCILSYIAEEEHLKIRLMGQGDNQIVRIMMPTTRWRNYKKSDHQMRIEAWKISQEYTRKMEMHFGMAQLPIKIRETWVSTRLFMYGKMMLHDGIVTPQWYKKILRSYALSNEGMVTISGVIGTIATNMAAAAGASDSPDVMYIIYLIMAEWSLTYLLKYHPFTRQRLLESHELRVRIPGHGSKIDKRVRSIKPRHLSMTMMMVPTAVGGSITIPLTGFIMRGFPDHASEGYAWLKMLKSVPSCYQQMFANWYSFLQNQSIEPDMLIQSPFSLNHLKPPTPGIQSREIVRGWLLSGEFSQNRFLREAGPVLDKFDRKKVCLSLLTDPINPLVSYEVYNTFPHVYLDGVIRRVENTRTIRKIALERQSKTRVMSRMMESEHNHIVYLMWRAEIQGEVFSECPTKHTRVARDIGWGRKIIGITTPHPLELLLGTVCEDSRTSCPETDYIYTRVDPNGDFAPYLGSKVRVKVISDQDQEARREPLINFGARVCRYAPWLKLGDNYMNLIIENINLVCDTSIFSTFIDDDPSGQLSSGSIEHRFNPSGSSEGCFINYAPQLGKTVYMSSDNMPTYGRGRVNYTLHFQALYCWIQYVMSRKVDSVYSHHHLECQDCIVPTEDLIPDLSSQYPLFDDTHNNVIKEHINNALGFLDVKPTVYCDNTLRLEGIFKELSAFNSRDILNGLQWVISVKIASQLIYGSTSATDDAKVEDLQEYPRIYSYKVYRDVILRRICILLIVIGSAILGLTPESTNLTKVRRYISDKILNSHLGSFKGLGSLIIGRNDLNRKSANLFITTEFPDSVQGTLKVAKSSILNTIPTIGKISIERMGRCPIPVEELSRQQFYILLMTRTFIEGRCSFLFNRYSEYIKDNESSEIRECRHRHTLDALRASELVHASMDRMFKCVVSSKTERVPPARSRLTPISQSYLVTTKEALISTTYYGIGKPEFCQRHSYGSRLVTLPTGSIYKWDDVFRSSKESPLTIILGDGTGGTSLSCVANWKDTYVFPCALLERKNMIPQDLGSMQPGLTRRMLRIKPTVMESIPDDVTHPMWVRLLSKEIQTMEVSNVTVVSDIESLDSRILFQQLTSLPMGLRVLVKCYINDVWDNPEILKGIGSLTILTSSMGNLHYGEIFVDGVICPGLIPDTMSLRMKIHDSYQEAKQNRFEERYIIYLIDIEQRYMNIAQMSRNISLYHLAGLHMIFNKEHIRLNADELWSYYMQYINTHFTSFERKIMIRETRILTPALTEELTRVGKIILIIITGEVEQVVSSSIRVGQLSIKNIPTLRTGLAPRKSTCVTLTKKDLLVAECLRGYRKTLISSSLELYDNWETDHQGWFYRAVTVRSFAESIYEYSSSDCIDVYETE